MEAAADGTCLIPAGAVDTDCKCLFEREEALRDDSLQQQQKRREKKIVKIKGETRGGKTAPYVI